MKNKIKLSVLIPTIYGSEDYMERLQKELDRQIIENKYFDIVEVLIFKDKKGENTIGYKRNELLNNSKGEYTVFIDCDDMINENYLKLIIDLINEEKPDVIKLEGIITVNGTNPKKFIHSIEYKDWYEKDNIYYRNPNHLNPMKSKITKKFKFKEINFGEDRQQSKDILEAKVLKKESTCNQVLYYYEYITNK